MHVFEATPPRGTSLVASASWYWVSRCDNDGQYGADIGCPKRAGGPGQDAAVGVQKQHGRCSPHTEVTDQVEVRLGIDLDVRDTLDSLADLRQRLPSLPARSAEGGREVHHRRPLAKDLDAELSWLQPDDRLVRGPLRTVGVVDPYSRTHVWHKAGLRGGYSPRTGVR